MGELPENILHYIFQYDFHFTRFLYLLDRAVSDPKNFENSQILERFLMTITYLRIDCVLSLAYLNKEILNNMERFTKCQNYLKDEYERARNWLNNGEVLPDVIYSSLRDIEEFFRESNALDEISPLLKYEDYI